MTTAGTAAMSHDNGPWDESLESMRVRLRLGAWVILLCIALFAVSDFREPPSVRAQLQFLRIVQFSAIALALYLNSRTTSRHVLLAMGVAFISMVCVTSALAGCFRGDPRTQVVTDLALTLATSATLPWGALPQMICVLVAGASMLLGVWWTYGTLAAMTAHTVVGVTAAFIASIYIAYQFQQYRQARDVAEAELAEARDQALTSARAKTIFLANMSHEIRTPMNVIIGMTDMALDADLPAEPREYLRRVRASATSLLGIINDVLDYSKMEDGKLTLHVIDMSLRATIDDVVALFTPSAEAKHLVLASIVADELPASVVGDPGRLRQVLTNLVGNALKFTETGSVTIEVSVVDPVARRVTVRIAVRDTGIGIPLDQQVSMFERFTQVDTATTSPYGGTGLGLTICRELVTLMGGQMAIESTPDVGTTIWFDVAFELGASELEARVERSYAPGKRPSSRRIVAESK